MPFATLLIALLTPTAHAVWSWADMTPTERKRFERELGSFREAHSHARDELPPCEGLDHLSNAAFKFEVSGEACPNGRRFYDQLHSYDQTLRSNCREMSGWLEGEFRTASPIDFAAARTKLGELMHEGQGLRRDARGEYDLDSYGGDFPEELLETEQKKFDCGLSITMMMQYRKWALSMMQEHYSRASRALDGEPGAVEDYLRYLRSGNAEP